jgi:hypothetical protein
MIHKAFALKGESSLFIACGEARGGGKPKAVIVLLRLRGDERQRKAEIHLIRPRQRKAEIHLIRPRQRKAEIHLIRPRGTCHKSLEC